MHRFLIYIFFLLVNTGGYATHIAGADLTYKCLGGNDYIITLTFYRDCSGIEAPFDVLINFKSGCYPQFDLKLLPVDSTGNEVTPTCPKQLTSCQKGNLYGLQQFIYQANVILPPCKNWEMSYYLCCRNYSNTIVNSQSTGMFILATLNNYDVGCNSAPAFSNIPVTILCNSETFCFNHGAIDPDGDSLHYSLITPFDRGPGGFPSNVLFYSGYSAEQPFPSDPPVYINSATGDICMSPSANIIAPLAVLIEEFRNGIKTGSVMRDMQVNVIYCDNHLPVLSGIDSASANYDPFNKKFTDTLCLGKTIDFTIYAFDPDSGNLSINWNKGIPDAKFIINNNNSPNPSARFIWKPDNIDLRNSAHCFTASISDDACPYVGTQTFSYCISVKGFKASLGKDTVLCSGESLLISAKTDTNAINFKWFIDGNYIPLPDNSDSILINTDKLSVGMHRLSIEVSDNSSTTICSGYSGININIVDNPVSVLPDFITICQGANAKLDAGNNAKRYLWNTGDTTSSIFVNSQGTYNVLLDGGYGTRCNEFDTVSVKVIPMPNNVFLGNDTCILSQNPNLTLDAGNNSDIFKYYWNTGETSQKISIFNSGKYIASISSDLITGCFKSDSINISILKPDFLGTDTTLCSSTTITLHAPQPPEGYNYSFKWMPSELTSSQITFNDLEPGKKEIYLQVDRTCIDNFYINVIVCDLIIPDIVAPYSSYENRVFKIKNLEYFPQSHLIIYNRWGKKIYENADYSITSDFWNGSNNPAGVYFYVLHLSNNDVKRGSITLIK